MTHTARPATRAGMFLAAVLALAALPALAAPTSPAPVDAAVASDHFVVGYEEGAHRGDFIDVIGADGHVRLERVRTLDSGADLMRASRPLDRQAAEKVMAAIARDLHVTSVEVDRTQVAVQDAPAAR